MSFNAFALCSLRCFKLKTEGQTIYTENVTSIGSRLCSIRGQTYD